MAQPSPTFFEEALNALRGCVALVTGQRDVARYFDFSLPGLVGSFIAVALAVLIAGFGPMLVGIPVRAGEPTSSIILQIVLFAAQAGTAWLVLRQLGRLDGFVPYLVASNWVTLASGMLVLISVFFGQLGLALLFVIAVIALLTFINVGRYIVTLKPMQILLLFVSQAVGLFIALAVVSVFIPPPGT